MEVSAFLSHNSLDKPFTRKLYRDLENHGIKCWIDEAEMKIGDSLIQKIREGIDKVDYFIIILSTNSISAPWVVNELDVAMNLQIGGKSIKVLPLMLEDCDPPGFLLGKLYGNFKNESFYEESLKKLLVSMEIIFNKNVLSDKLYLRNLGTAVDKAISFNLPLMHAPFHRPFQYIGMTIDRAEKALEVSSNEVGNIRVENEECSMFLEVEGNFVNFIEVDFKKTIPHYQDKWFDSETLLGSLSISLSELDLTRKERHCHIYYDHRRRLKVSVMCAYDGGPISVAFCSKYYGM
jgi:hypothetical protein